MLTVSEYGYGKRSSSYDFRITGRGGKGIRATDIVARPSEIGQLVAAFPVEDGDQIMLVTDGGQLIRTPVDQIRLASRATKGVTIFNTGGEQKVVSVELISEPEEDGTNGNGAEQGEGGANDAECRGSLIRFSGGIASPSQYVAGLMHIERCVDGNRTLPCQHCGNNACQFRDRHRAGTHGYGHHRQFAA